MLISVIISTFNSPLWLEKVLLGYSLQEYPNFELIVADDGSSSDTSELIKRIRATTALQIKHVWQEDRGFRKCRILNKAILHATGPYLVITDGDCIPRKDFLAVHARKALPGHFLSGGYYKLSMNTSKAIGRQEIVSGDCFAIGWLYAHGLNISYRNLKLIAVPRLAAILNTITTTRCNFKGANASLWKSDALRVNGFDERMSWGGEDREFGVRLKNVGVRPRHVRYDAIVIHLAHTRDYVNQEVVKANKALRIASEMQGKVLTPCGIQELLAAGYEVS